MCAGGQLLILFKFVYFCCMSKQRQIHFFCLWCRQMWMVWVLLIARRLTVGIWVFRCSQVNPRYLNQIRLLLSMIVCQNLDLILWHWLNCRPPAHSTIFSEFCEEYAQIINVLQYHIRRWTFLSAHLISDWHNYTQNYNCHSSMFDESKNKSWRRA